MRAVIDRQDRRVPFAETSAANPRAAGPPTAGASWHRNFAANGAKRESSKRSFVRVPALQPEYESARLGMQGRFLLVFRGDEAMTEHAWRKHLSLSRAGAYKERSENGAKAAPTGRR